MTWTEPARQMRDLSLRSTSVHMVSSLSSFLSASRVLMFSASSSAFAPRRIVPEIGHVSHLRACNRSSKHGVTLNRHGAGGGEEGEEARRGEEEARRGGEEAVEGGGAGGRSMGDRARLAPPPLIVLLDAHKHLRRRADQVPATCHKGEATTGSRAGRWVLVSMDTTYSASPRLSRNPYGEGFVARSLR